MKFSAIIQFSAQIENFEKFDYVEFDYIEYSDEMKRTVASNFEPKKLRLVIDLSPIEPEDDGYSVVVTPSHLSKAKFHMQEEASGIFALVGEATMSVPLKLTTADEKKFTATIISADLWRGTENEVKLVLEPVEIKEFNIKK